MAGLTVVTWNAQGSQGLDVAAAAAGLQAFDPDLVFMQEVQRRQLGALGSALGGVEARWRFKHWPVTVPAEGLGILSRRPLGDVHVQVLAHRWRFWDWRRRIAVHASVEIGSRRIHVVDVHLGAGVTMDERVRQAEQLMRHAPSARIIAGDFNATPASAVLAACAHDGWRDAEHRIRGDSACPPTNWTPGPRTAPPTQRLDYLLVDDDVTVVEAFVPDHWGSWAPLSDHLPAVARLGI